MENRGVPRVSFCRGKRNWTEEWQSLDADNGAKVSFVKVLQRHSRTVTRFYARSSLRNELPLRTWVSTASASTSCPLFLVRAPPSFRVLVAVYVLNLLRLLMKTDGLKNAYLEEVARRVVASVNEAEGENGDEKGRWLRLKRADVITIETHSDMLIRFEDLNNRLTLCSVRPRRAHTVFTIGWKLTKLRNALTFFRAAIVGRDTIG